MFSGGFNIMYLRFTSPRGANNRYEWRQGSRHFRFCPETQKTLQYLKHANASAKFSQKADGGGCGEAQGSMVSKVRVTIIQKNLNYRRSPLPRRPF